MMTKYIKHIMLENDIKIIDLAKKINTSPNNLTNKFKRDNFSTSELQEIAEALGYKLVIEFIPNNDK